MVWLRRILWTYGFVGVFGLLAFSLAGLPPSPHPGAFAGLVIAHRGDTVGFPENTLAAVDGARALGADAVEVDVMLSEDGVPVVIHDATVERTTDGVGLVRNHTLAELRALRLRGPGGEGFAEGSIPTLEEVVDRVVALDMKLEIELKTETVRTYALGRAIAALFAERDLYERAFVSSFDPRFLYYVRDTDPRIVTSLALMEEPPYGPLVEFLLRREGAADFLGVGIIEPERTLADEAFIARWRARGRVIDVWTVNAERHKVLYRGEGVSYTTDCPSGGC